MAERQHILWLCEGVDSWNAKRPQHLLPLDPDFFWPDFTEANLSFELEKSSYEVRQGVFLKGFVLDGINLKRGLFQDASLPSFSLREANLEYANLERAFLSDSSLRKAKLNGANLTGAHLVDADLQGAELIHANFTRADLQGANLNGAILKNTILTGTDLTNAKPWTSILFPDPKDAVTEPLPNFPEKVEKVGDLVNIRRFFKNHYENSSEETSFNDGCVLYFRGEGNNSWELRPYIMRNSPGREAILRDKEGEMLLDLMSQRPEDFTGATSALSQWVIAQHHGLKTRLLDITRNPLVALFHACECPPDSDNGTLHVFVVPKDIVKTFDSDAVSVVANLAKLPRSEQDRLMGKHVELDKNPLGEPFTRTNKYFHTMDRLYHYIRQEKPHFKERIDPRDMFRVFVVEPQQSFERIKVQSGAFLISAFHERFETEKIRELNKNTPVYHHYKLTVPADGKNDILDELKFLNITSEVLFPGLDEAAKAIVRHYEQPNS